MAISWEQEQRDRVWRANCQFPSPCHAHALRLLLGLSARRAAILTELPLIYVTAFEREELGAELWYSVSRRLHLAYAKLGGRWCSSALHEGAHLVYLDRTRAAGASDRQAFGAALALMVRRARSPQRRVSFETLARRVAGRLRMPVSDVKAALRGKGELPPHIRRECFRRLGQGRGGAGAYFKAAPLGGWQLVGCDSAGCWW